MTAKYSTGPVNRRVWSVSVCLTFLSVSHCSLHYDLISHYKRGICSYIGETYGLFKWTLCIILHYQTQWRVREHCVFLHSHCLCPSSWAVPSPTPLLYVDSPLITFKWPSGPHTQQAASMETVCLHTKGTLFLWEQHPSSRDLFMCQVDGSDTLTCFWLSIKI